MVNPYYYFFYLFYKLLYPIAKEKDRLPFGITLLMGLVLMVHGFATLIIIERVNNLSTILPEMNKFLFGIILFVLFFLLNHFLFERNERYLRITKEITDSSYARKTIALILLIGYLIIPILIKSLST